MSMDERMAVLTTRANRQHLVHILPSFGVGGVPLRTVVAINDFGRCFRHTIIALDNKFDAATGLSPDLDVNLLSLHWVKKPALLSIIHAMYILWKLRPDLVLTYNWGAIEWAVANRVAALSRQIHFEDGFGKDEVNAQFRRRVLLRHWALARCAHVVVPSLGLEDIASRVWRLPRDRIVYIPNGVDIDRFSKLADNPVPYFTKRPTEVIIGTVAPLRPEKNIGRLLRAFAEIDQPTAVRLVIAGEGAERTGLELLAQRLGIADRVVFTGHVAPEKILGSFDIFAISSDTEQMPITLLEAMAASRPIVAVDVGDVKSMLSEENREFVARPDDVADLARKLSQLLQGPATRIETGRKNRERVTEFSQKRMLSAYFELYAGRRL